MECPYLKECKFLKNFSNDKCAEALIMLYCKDDFKNCARYKKREAGIIPEPNLWPNGQLV